MGTRRIARVVARGALGGVLVIALAACGDDDGNEAAAAEAGSFCDDLVAFNTAVMETDVSPESSEEEVAAAAAQITPRWDAVTASAPAELEDDVAPMTGVVDALAEGDAESFNSEETFVQYTALVGRSVEVCDFETSAVEAGDYWFKGVSDDLKAGTVAVQLTNVSESEVHEFVVFKKNDPALSAGEFLDMDEAAMEKAVTFTGATFAPPGETATGLMGFETGSYLAVCFVPIGGADDAAPHFTAGQVAEFSVS
jgi:uncharacterized cupredoxin-like copper-binding protein